jgi:RNA polymerase sigma factor (sigma-70 family)
MISLTQPSPEFNTQLIAEISSLNCYAMKFTKDNQDKEDLVQETLIKALRYSKKYQSGTNFKAWLFVIMRNTYINNYRKMVLFRAKFSAIDDETSSFVPSKTSENMGENRFLNNDISTALKKLPNTLSLPFMLYVDGYKYVEIAKEIGVPIGTIKTRIHVGRIKLKKMLKEYCF